MKRRGPLRRRSLNESIIRGEFEERPLPFGGIAFVSKDFSAVPEEELAAVVERVRDMLNGSQP